MNKLPQFANDQEEAEFWNNHDATDYLDEFQPVEMTFRDSRPPKKQISLRLDTETIDSLKNVARKKGIGYQTLIRMWVVERLAHEHQH